MAWSKRTASDFKNCLAQIVDFATKEFEAENLTPGTNTGNGTVYGISASHESAAETWTLTCTTGGGNGTAVFSVFGSVSGAKASATSGTPYSIAETSFTIVAGTVNFIIGDSFTFDVVASTALWEVLESDFVSSQNYVIMKGVGGGTDEIFIGFRTQSNGTTYFNLEVTVFSGYVNGNTYDNQPGIKSYYTLLTSVAFDFHVFMTGRSIKLVAAIGVRYEGFYAGWFLPNATASQYTYPAFVGGSSTTSTRLIGDETTSHTNYWRGLTVVCAVMDGSTWVGINRFIPLTYAEFDKWFFDIFNNRTVYPAEIVNETNVAIYGRLEGVFYVTNGDSAITPSDILIDGQAVYITTQDSFRTGTINVAAMELIGD